MGPMPSKKKYKITKMEKPTNTVTVLPLVHIKPVFRKAVLQKSC